MGIAKEQLYDNQQEAFYEMLAERLGITCDEVEEIEPQINENTGSDGAVYGYYLTFKEDAPREILDKIEGLDSNDWYWMDISEVYDKDYDEEQYIHIVKKESPYNDFITSMDETLSLMDIPVKKTEQRYILYRQIYSSIISIMETYLCERLLKSIDSDERLLQNYILYHKSKTDYNEEDIREARCFLMEKQVYHRLNKVSKIYTATFNFTFPQYESIGKAITTRNDIVHRNGKTTNRKPVIISKKDIKRISEDVKRLISKIEYDICNPSLPFEE